MVCIGVFTERNNVELPIIALMGTGGSRCVLSGSLHVEGPFWNRWQELAEFVFLGATCFELLLIYFIMTSVQTSKCTNIQRRIWYLTATHFVSCNEVPAALCKSIWLPDLH